MKRNKIFYVPGLISILGLPILLAFWGPEDPVQTTAMRLFLPSDQKPPPGVVTFNRYEFNRLLKTKKIVETELHDRPSILHPEYNAYRTSNFVLSELARLQFTHDTSEVLKVHFGEETIYGEFVWALDNATLFGYRRYVYLDDDLYYLPNPPPRPVKLEDLYIESYPAIVRPSPPPPTRWQRFLTWVDWQWLYLKFYLRYNYVLISGFLLLILLPGIVGTVRRYRVNRPFPAVRP